MPILTVTLPVYNAMPYLPFAVESVLQQSYDDFRFLIIDDGSTDDSTKYLRTLGDRRVTLIEQKNAGLGATLNRLLDRCETEYFARMDADDICHPCRIEKQLRFLRESPKTILLGSHIRFLFDTGVLQTWKAPLDHKRIHATLLSGRFSISHPTIVFRTEIAKKIGGYRVHGAGEDLDFLLRMCESGSVANLPDILYDYRMHNQSINARRRSALHIGYTYALECAKQRETELPERSLEDFENEWAHRGVLKRCTERIWDLADSLYRRGLRFLAGGCILRGGVMVAFASILRPVRTWKWLLGYLTPAAAEYR